MRAVLLAVLVVLACTLSVSASSADWSAPDALWSSDLSASELEARHSEFLMAASATGPASSTGPTKASSTGPAKASSTAGAGPTKASSTAAQTPAASSTGPAVVGQPAKVADKPVNVKLKGTDQCAEQPNLPICLYTPAKEVELGANVKSQLGFPRDDLPGEAFIPRYTKVSTAAAGRRLLADGDDQVQASFDFIGSSVDNGAHALAIYTAFFKLLDPDCGTECKKAVQKDFNLPGDIANDPTFNTLATAVVPGSLQADSTAVAKGTEANDAANAANNDNARNVESAGGPRNTNVGYYVLGAVLLAFIVGALIFFIVHKKPVAAQLAKEDALRTDEVQLAPVVTAAPLHSGVVVQEEAPLAANQQQMDYRSVFALKHNVLDKSAEQKAAEEDEHNHNDVHFILHQ